MLACDDTVALRTSGPKNSVYCEDNEGMKLHDPVTEFLGKASSSLDCFAHTAVDRSFVGLTTNLSNRQQAGSKQGSS